jgi:hypothetical protein
LDFLLHCTYRDKGPDVVAALKLASAIIGPFGRIALFLGSVPSGTVSFSRVAVEAESLALRGANFSPHFAGIVSLLQRHEAVFDVFIDSLCARLIDCATFSRVASATGGCVTYVNPTQHWCLDDRLFSHLSSSSVRGSVRVSQCTLAPSLGLVRQPASHFRVPDPSCVVFPLLLPSLLRGPVTAQAVFERRSPDGFLRYRSVSRSFEPTDDLATVFDSADALSLLKWASNSLLTSFFHENVPLARVRGVLQRLLAPPFAAYRFHVARSADRLSRLVLPASLAPLPRQTLGVVRSTALSPGISLDERAYELACLDRMAPRELGAVAYPPMFDLVPVLAGAPPAPLPLAERELVPARILVLFDGFATYLWLGQDVDAGVCNALFGRPSTYGVDRIRQFPTSESRALYEAIRGNVRMFVGGGNTLAMLFRDRLIEDPGVLHCSCAAWVEEINRASRPANTSYEQVDL